MTKSYEALETTILHIELLRRIPPYGRKTTARQLLEQLSTETGIVRDVRTIQRQLEALSSHFDIDRDDRSKPYGYSWRKGSKGLAVASLSTHESLLLNMAKQHLSDILPSKLMASMDEFFIQAQRNLLGQDAKTKNARDWLKKVKVLSTSQPLLPPEISVSVFDTISTALYENLYVDITYRNYAGKESKGRIMPLALMIQGPRQYLVCRYEKYHTDERTLALHRIVSANMTTLTFTPPVDFDLNKYAQSGKLNFGRGEKITLSFQMNEYPAKHLIETPLSKDQTAVELKNGRFKITATVVDSLLLTAFLNSFGEEISHITKKEI